MNRTSALRAAWLITAATSPYAAQAQENANDIVVTARRQEERLQDVPISITAVSSRQLDERNVRSIGDLPSVAPGLSGQVSSTGTTVNFSIRGQGIAQGQNSPGVAPYFADVPEFSTQFYDLQSVQVLKGPQGTLFGRNTTGGAILFTPRRPTDEAEGFVLGRFGEDNRHDIEFGVGGPIVADKILVRFSGMMLRRSGYGRNLTYGTRVNGEHKDSLRGNILIRPFEGLENSTIYEYTDIDENGATQTLAGIEPTSALASRLQPFLDAQNARSPYVIATSRPLFLKMRSKGVINTTSLTLGDNFSLKNIFSSRKFRASRAFDLDGTPQELLDVTNVDKGNSTARTEEVQARATFDRLQGVIGYYNEKVTEPFGLAASTKQYIAAFGGSVGADIINGQTVKSAAVFGEATFQATDDLFLTAGIRRTKDKRSFQSRTNLLVPGFPPGALASVAGSFKATTWNINALYKFTPDISVYTTVRHGYKAGGFNANTSDPALIAYQPETVTDYEIGLKSSFDVGSWKARANVDLFYDDYKDIQRQVLLPTVPVATYTTNAAKGDIKGVDLDLGISPGRFFDLSLRYTYLKTKYGSYVDFIPTPTGLVSADLSSSAFPNSPKHQLSVTPRFTLPVDKDVGEISALASLYYQSGTAIDPANRIDGVLQRGSTIPGYTTVDLRADWRHIAGSQFSAALYARNVLDKRYVAGTANQLKGFGMLLYTYGQPRLIGAEARFEF
ncbi:MAG: hypothetical protein JWR77_1764 [Rhizorhabdus sp.]|nr:hypothetical protein [Rhizorhabdus sp.]